MKRRVMVQRTAKAAAGIAMAATSLGLSGAGMASAAAPGAQSVQNDAFWTLFFFHNPEQCQKDIFFTTHHRFGANKLGDKGTWSGGGRTIKMVWKHGADAGLTFSGTWFNDGLGDKYYSGTFGGTDAGDTGTLTKGMDTAC